DLGVCFFFQAEDGIRGRTVTGVQTCALPISTRLRGPDVWEFRWREAGADGKRKHRRIVIGSVAQFSDKSEALLEVAALRRKINRSEERRVGKEGRRGGEEHRDSSKRVWKYEQ